MNRKADYILDKAIAVLICTGLVFSILFGQGTHLHSIFDHFFDHGDIHVYVHSHNHSSDHKHNADSGFNLEDSHNHPISKLNLKSVRASTPHQDVLELANPFVGISIVGTESNLDDLQPAYLDLPPPDRISDLYRRYSFSLRAPPVG